jgi:hypothetical protein
VLGALLSLGVVGGFVAFYLREQRLRTDLDPYDDDDARDLMGGTVFKYGCLLFAVATAATAFVGLMQYLLIDRRRRRSRVRSLHGGPAAAPLRSALRDG